jgi:tetraacyldisaccharide 4'-kinase
MNKIRLLLLPLSLIYGWILWLRNKAFDWGLLKSESPKIKTITVGNLSLGGTGKTPHLSYLLHLLSRKNIAVLSRGYGRQTKGTLKVTPKSFVSDVGDEPLQIASNFPNQTVYVDENRLRGIDQIQANHPETEAVLLDDAMQHRKLKSGFNILLTTWDEPFYKDHYLPAGNLRDHKTRACDADIIVVTKCPEKVSQSEMETIRKKLSKYSPNIFFDRIAYQDCIPLNNIDPSALKLNQKVLLVSGIAKPQFLVEKVKRQYDLVEHFEYRDHYGFKAQDIQRIRNFIGRFAPGEIAVITTEKDAMRLRPLTEGITHSELPIFYWQIGIAFERDKNEFDKLIIDYVG